MLTAALFGIAHAVVDAATVTAVLRTSHARSLSPEAGFAVVVGYDLFAFGSQVILGWLTDRYTTPKYAILVGLGLTLLSLGLYPMNAPLTVACAGIGNALFHLGAGATVLRGGLERAAPAGVFVAPGALGLAFGMAYGARPKPGPIWPLVVLVTIALVAVTFYRGLSVSKSPKFDRIAPAPCSWNGPAQLAIGLLLLSIVVRSLVGFSAARGYARTELLVLGIPLCAFFGKLLGGIVADRLGWLETSGAALLLSIPLIALAPAVPWLLCGLLLFQMTMPVTLTAVARLLPDRLATAFGWTCLALIVGALPTMFPAGSPLCTRSLLGVWIAVGVVSLYAGLRILGIPHRRFVVPIWSVKAEMKS
jgi:MFS transporter, FSR family, fosmidomycin resistance protein